MSQHDTLTLEHCPFCGKSHTPKIVLASEHWADEYDGYYPHSESYAVMCDASSPNGPGGCGASGGFKETEADAIAAWNRRAALSATQPAQAQQAGEVVTLGALAKRNVFDAIREAYDLGYNDARNARAVPGDSAPGYAGRDVESDHGGALFNTLNRRLANTTPPAPAQPVQGVPDEWRSALTQCVQALEFAHHKSGVVQGMPCVSEAIVSGTALLTSSATPPAQPAVAQGAGEVVAELKRLASVCPELNLNNYGPDDVDELNAWAVEVAQAIDQLSDTQPAAGADVLDAQRYRWLRDQHQGQTEQAYDAEGFPLPQEPTAIACTVFKPGRDLCLEPISCTPGELDAHIDAAIAASGRKS